MIQTYIPTVNNDPTKAVLGNQDAPGSNAVSTLQTNLNNQNKGVAGYNPLVVDGKYGQLTQAATQFKAPTTTPTTPPATTSTTSTQNSSTSTTAPNTGTSTSTLDDTKAKLTQTDQDYQTQAKSVQDTITNIQNGSIPLSVGEQAQIDGLKQQFQVLIDQQTLQNTSASGVANTRGYQTGAAEYDPTFQAKTIGSIVSSGQNKIADLNIKMASAVASLTQSLKDNDIKSVKNAWDIYAQAAKERTDSLNKVISDAQSAIKDAQAQANWQSDQELQQMTFAEKVKTDQFDQVYKMEDLALKRKANSIAASLNVPTVQTSPSGAPNKASQQQFLASIPGGANGAMGTAIQALSTYTIDPNTFSSRIPAGQTESQRQQLVTLAKQYDPTFDEKMYSVRAKYQKDLTSTSPSTVGGAINSANKAVNHLTAFVTDVSKAGNTASSTANWFLNNTVGQVVPGQRTNIGAAKTEGLGVADELAKFFKGSGATDVKSIEEWKSRLSTNASPADVKGLTQGAITLLAGQLETLSEQYTTTMGKPPTSNFLGASAMTNLSNLKNQGYKVDIPGVIYTDKNAWQKLGGGTQDQWNQAVETLTNAGYPLTQENILQVAQSQ